MPPHAEARPASLVVNSKLARSRSLPTLFSTASTLASTSFTDGNEDFDTDGDDFEGEYENSDEEQDDILGELEGRSFQRNHRSRHLYQRRDSLNGDSLQPGGESTASPSSPQSPRVAKAKETAKAFEEASPGDACESRFDTARLYKHVKEEELFDGLKDERNATTMGVLRDFLGAYRFGTKGAFGFATTTTSFFFGLGQKALELNAYTFDALGLSKFASAVQHCSNGLHSVQQVTHKGLQTSEEKIMRIFEHGDKSLALRGGEYGDLIRWMFGDGHYREAMLCVMRLLYRLGTGLEHQNPLILAAGFRAMVRAQALEKQDRIVRRQENLRFSFIPLICQKRVNRWDLFMRFSAAAYGPQLLRLLRAVPQELSKSVKTLSQGITALTGVPEHDVIFQAPGSVAMYSPAHYIAVDHAHENIVVVIRGTMHIADLLVDLVCEQVNFTCQTDEDTHGPLYGSKTVRERRKLARKRRSSQYRSRSCTSLDQHSIFLEDDGDKDTDDDDDYGDDETASFFSYDAEDDEHSSARGFKGKAHRGFLIAARNLAVSLYDKVQDALDQYPDYKLVVTGHSMGAGIASLLTLLWAQAEAFGPRTNDMHAFAFGSPCSLCHELAQSSFTRRFVTAVVVGDDFVSRLSFSTVHDVQLAINAYAAKGFVLSVDEIREVYRTLEKDAMENKLFSAGTVWLLDSDEFNMNPVEIDPRELLHSLEFSESFLTAHLPIRYLNAIANAKTFTSPHSLPDVQILNSRPNPQDTC